MPTVFLSYSLKDHFFAEAASLKLAEARISLWRDLGQLRAGADWRYGIEEGIANSLAVLVALSANSADSAYVTYEWAYALGKGKVIIPAKLSACTVHPKLETIQYLDFTIPGALPWELLIERIREIESAGDTAAGDAADCAAPAVEDPTAQAILAYLNQRGHQAISFDRVIQRIDKNLTVDSLKELVNKHRNLFRPTVIQGGKPGLAKEVP